MPTYNFKRKLRIGESPHYIKQDISLAVKRLNNFQTGLILKKSKMKGTNVYFEMYSKKMMNVKTLHRIAESEGWIFIK